MAVPAQQPVDPARRSRGGVLPRYLRRLPAVDQPVRTHRWGVGAFLLVEAVLLASAVLITTIMQPGETTTPAESTVLVGTIVPTVLAAAVALLITVLRGNGPRVDLRIYWRSGDLWTGFKLGCAGLVLTVVAVEVWTKIVGQANATSAVGALEGVDRLSVPSAAVMFGYTWLLGPICEELIFRGMCWGAMERLHWGRWAAFVLSTAIFAASHLEPLRTSLLLVISIPIGLARLITGRLTASVIAHMMNNFLPALVLLLISVGVMS